MKKTISLAALLISFSLVSTAQIQRTVAPKPKKDSIINNMQGETVNRKQMMKELNLTREQRGKMKEAMQDVKTKKDAIDADTTLSTAARQQKMRELRKTQMEKMNDILTPEQKEKFRKIRLDKKDMKKGEMDGELEQ